MAGKLYNKHYQVESKGWASMNTSAAITVPANNIVRLSTNGVILMVVTGQQTRESVAELYMDLAELIKQLHLENKPALIINDIDHMVHSPKAGEAEKEALKVLSLPFDAMAVCYGTSKNVELAHKLAKLASVENYVRTFASTRMASRWLAKFIVTHRA
jgi:hypothetical protein